MAKLEKRFYPDMVLALVNEDGSLNIVAKDGKFYIEGYEPEDPEDSSSAE